MKNCIFCNKAIQDDAKKCYHCGNWQNDNGNILKDIQAARNISWGGGFGKSMGIFMAANVGIMAVLMVIVRCFEPEAGIGTAVILLLFGCAIPGVMLFFSKPLLKWEYDIRIIDEENADENEKFLLSLVRTLASRINLPAVPEVGIYESEEMNAFATGSSKKDSMIAFSSGLLKNMDQKCLAGVAAHETAHIANGDMLTMTLLEGLVNTAVIVLDFAMRQMDWYEELREKSRLTASIVNFIIVNVMFLLGDLVLLWFSRHREFEADATAASLVGNETMARALKQLMNDSHSGECVAADSPAAAMMISAPDAWIDILSTHPSLERRINKLLSTDIA